LQRWPLPAWVPAGGRTAAGALTRLLAAASLFAIEMQLATWFSIGTLRSLFFFNAAVLVVAVATAKSDGATVSLLPSVSRPSWYHVALGALAILVATVNVMLPLQAADPYHLERVALIERLGTLAYEPFIADPKVNVLGWIYELLLADVDQIPLLGRALLQVHGVIGLLLYTLAVASARRWFPSGRAWCNALVFVVPVVFHQLVLVKNDLFGSVPALVALAWLAARGSHAPANEIGWAAWLIGFAVAVKLTSAPLALVFAGVLLIDRTDRLPALRFALAGGLVGALCGGLAFTLIENARWYGHPVAVQESGGLYNRNGTLHEMAVGIGRFAISLFDLGQVTRTIWPGRGGWGSTFGLPVIWALAVLAIRYRSALEARRALWIAGACFLIFAAVYTDADIAHRLAIAPGVLLILVALSLSDGDDLLSRRLRLALGGVIVLSAAQIVRSAVLYLNMS
jgi:hypothetical protein